MRLFFGNCREKRCIFIYSSNFYEVKTPRGWFRLDEGAYQDYLEGKLWINWVPGKDGKNATASGAAAGTAPVNISDEAVRLYDLAAGGDALDILQRKFPGEEIVFPYRKRMNAVPVEEMNLSVRSMNGLHRAGIHTLGGVMSLLEMPLGIRNLRNLGTKSEKEITEVFFSECYSLLTRNEKLEFWQKLLDQ